MGESPKYSKCLVFQPKVRFSSRVSVNPGQSYVGFIRIRGTLGRIESPLASSAAYTTAWASHVRSAFSAGSVGSLFAKQGEALVQHLKRGEEVGRELYQSPVHVIRTRVYSCCHSNYDCRRRRNG